MSEEFIKIIPSKKDLPYALESWKECTYDERNREIIEHSIMTRGCPPAFNMLYIKEAIFSVPVSVELHHLLILRQKLRKKFGVDCFQISIDRHEGKVHMLFDWYDRKTQQSYYLYEAKIYNFCVVIIQTLNLKVPNVNIKWLRYFLIEEYLQDNDVFDKLDEWVRHQKPSQRNYQVFHNALAFVKLRCQGLIK